MCQLDLKEHVHGLTVAVMATKGSDPQKNDGSFEVSTSCERILFVHEEPLHQPVGDTHKTVCEYNRHVLLNSTTDNLLKKNKKRHETQQLEETFACYSSYSLRFTNCAVSQTDDLDFFVCIILLLVHFRDTVSVTSHFFLSLYLSIALPRLVVSANVSLAK